MADIRILVNGKEVTDPNAIVRIVDDRPHMGLKGKTPAEAAGISYAVRNWTDVVRMVEA